jgi:hypothetical protein
MSSADTCARCEAPLPRKPVRAPNGNLYCSGLCRFSARDEAARDEAARDDAPEPEASAIAPRPWQSELTRRDQVERGRTIAIRIIAMVLVIGFLASILQLASRAPYSVPIALWRIVAHGILCYFTWRGYAWVRWFLALSCMSAILAPIVLFLAFPQLSFAAVGILLALTLPFFVAGIVLLTSDPLRAFLAAQRASRLGRKQRRRRAKPRRKSRALARR